jgi:maltose/moltooligosaccharide transporter
MMGVPYIMVVSAIPKERYGVYMGIVNMMIVIPMILQTLSFGYVYDHLLGKDPGNVMIFASILLFLAALATMRIKVTEVSEDAVLQTAH